MTNPRVGRSRLRAARTANSGRVVTSATECSGLSATASGGFGYVRGDFLRGELFAVRLADVAVWLAVCRIVCIRLRPATEFVDQQRATADSHQDRPIHQAGDPDRTKGQRGRCC